MSETQKRPNILLIMADQLPARTLGTYGHPVVKSPHIDALAARGTRFDAAYTNCPICAPSRASMCTGQYVSNIGTYDNGTEFPAEIPTLAHYLRRAGYQTLLSGKMHFIGPDQYHGFERRLTSDIYPSTFVWTPDWNRGAYANEGTSVLQLKDAGRCKWNLQLDYDEEVRFRSLEAIRQLARTGGDDKAEPFFMCASFTHPHDPFIVPDKWWDRYDHDDIDMPTAPPDPIEEMHPYDQWLQIHHMVDVRAPSDEEVRNARHAFYGMVSYFDDIVGEMVAELERVGLAENTIVAITSDHGEMLGEHGMWFKRTYRDPSTRVPLIVAGPRVAAGETTSTVSLVDLLPTFLDFAEADAAETTDGDSFTGLLLGNDSNWKDYAVSEYYSEGTCQPMRMAVRAQLKYVYVHDEPEQLFDLAADPDELHNVIDDPSYSERLSELRDIVHDDWDPAALRTDVIRSQQRRRIINEAHASGRGVQWDAEPDFDAGDQYVRREDAQVTNRRWRL
jgi:choline-sulfatase